MDTNFSTSNGTCLEWSGWQHVLVYIDDICIFVLLLNNFSIVTCVNQAESSKSEIETQCMPIVVFLRHEVSANGVRPVPTNIKSGYIENT